MQSGQPRHHVLWEYIMKSGITKLAAAAAIIVAVVLSIDIWDKSIPAAYALDQTIEANHTVRYLHIKDFGATKGEPKEFWLEFDEYGEVKNVRMDFPEWSTGGDGPKVVVWKENKAEVWFKKKNGFLTVRDKTVADSMLKLAEECDPRLAVERLHKQERQGFYRLQDGKYRYTGKQEYYDYNQPIEAKMFTLDDEVPADVMRVDQTTQEVGLVQGSLADEEIAVEVVRQFFEALIAGDYAKAGKLLEGIPADRLQQKLSNIKFLRVASIGPAGPHPVPETKGLVVPCTVEIEKDEETSELKLDRLGVRQVYNQPGRWTIFGGI